ncbi:MAG: amino acid ABC transporter ATP-binding protein [Eubacterium sp.]|nr:amino acid ABC transporter ATP-binding protein [Eubacterium sp.]
MSLISIRNLTKEYSSVTPLDNLNLDINKGDIVGIIGPSGTGKSTLLRCINRLETPTSGTITINGVNVCDPDTDLSEVRKKTGMVFQSFNLFNHKNVLENIMMPQMDLLDATEDAAREEAEKQLIRVGLADSKEKYPDELSGGQKQRIAIARALAMHPDILLFDEPTSALDPTMVSEVLSVIADLAETGLTMMIVTHEMRLARDVCNRVIFMKGGHIVEDGSPEQVFDSPKDEETKNFIYRIKNFEYTIYSEYPDMYKLFALLDVFCSRQFMGSESTNRCRLAIEEAVTGIVAPFMKNAKGTITLRLNAGEGGKQMTLEIDHRDIQGNFDPFDQRKDEVSGPIFEKMTKRLPDRAPGIAVFEII